MSERTNIKHHTGGKIGLGGEEDRHLSLHPVLCSPGTYSCITVVLLRNFKDVLIIFAGSHRNLRTSASCRTFRLSTVWEKWFSECGLQISCISIIQALVRLLEMQTLGPQPKPTESETLGRSLAICFNKPSLADYKPAQV